MTTLVVGATGATGRWLVQQLLERGHGVKAIVRSPEKLPDQLANHHQLTVVHRSLLDLSDSEMAEHVRDCGAIASCLGHNLTFRGVFGPPRRLVTEATQRLCDAVKANSPAEPTRLVLMNTAGNSNRDLDERVSFAQRCVVGLVRWCVPPHADNEQAADYLRTAIGQRDAAIEWVAVRPDSLVDTAEVTRYELHASPTRSAIFNPGKTSRANVAHFMAELITSDAAWQQWQGQMPVIYNAA